MKENNITINFKKSNFLAKEIKYLGCIVNEIGIKPHFTALENFKIVKPKNVKNHQKLLGFLNYFRPFISNIRTKLHGLYDKIKKGKEWSWNNKDNEVINIAIEFIKKQITLHHQTLTNHLQ